MKTSRIRPLFLAAGFSAFCFLFSPSEAPAATFTNNASLGVASDPGNTLTSTNGTFTISCWFKLEVPSSATLSQNMTLFMDRYDRNEGANHSCQLRVNYTTGALEFTSRGGGGTITSTIAGGLFVGRWY
jgi:hypothetical protein